MHKLTKAGSLKTNRNQSTTLNFDLYLKEIFDQGNLVLEFLNLDYIT